MNHDFLDFEQPIAELQAKIEELRFVGEDNSTNVSEEIDRLENKCKRITEEIFSDLNSWQVSQIARHPRRPYSLDYIPHIFSEFHELHGDRNYADDKAVIVGLARLEGAPVAVIGHQKGRDTKEKVYRNFGMSRPEGYRKALRHMLLAEQFDLPLITFIDTPGAYPGIGAEERGQAEAIADNLIYMSKMKTPVLSIVIGEGASGGALGVGLTDKIICFENTWYSVISPEGCASILFRDTELAEKAADSMKITANDLKLFNIADHVIPEPIGGIHLDYSYAFKECKKIS